MREHNISIVIDPRKARRGAAQVNRSLDSIKKNTNDLNRSLKRSGSLTDSFSRKLSSLTGLLAAIQPARFMQGFIHQLIEADTLYMAFVSQMSTVNNSLEESKDAFIEVTKYAEAYSVPIDALTKGYAKLKASMDFDHLRHNFRGLFESTAMIGQVLHLNHQNMERVYNAIIQMMSKGKITSEELKEQLGEHLPGAVAMAAKAMDMSMEELFDKMEKGELKAKQFADAWPNYILERFGEASKLAAKSLQAAINTLDNAWQKLMIDMTTSG
ncbi:MAG: tape measure protein, partial [Actinobacteria bacterium]|nr:tape measure protein [Actinomycetota bacterium]